MPIEYWKVTGYVITLVSAVVMCMAFLRNRTHADKSCSPAATKGEIIVVLAFIAIGLLLRVNFLTEFQGGELTSDENMMSVVYTSGIINGEHVRSGAGKIVYALVLDAWLLLFGFSVTSIRALSTVASIAGIGFWFLALRLLYGRRLALWASALLSLSVFGIYFGRLSLEVYWPVFFVPLCLFIYAYWKIYPSIVIAAGGGVVAALGLFTYPGFLIAMIAVLGGLTTSWLWAFRNTSCDKAALKPNRRTVVAAVAAAAAFLVVTTFGVILHQIYAPPSEAMFTGGGGGHFSFSWLPVLAAIQQMLADLLSEGSSWYLIFQKMPFVEFVLWPFFVAGVAVSWGRAQDWRIHGIILSMPAVILLGALTGAYPGMRRAIYFLLPFYFFSAIGITRFFDCVQSRFTQEGSVSTYRAPGVVATLLVILALAHPLYYQLTYGRKAAAWNHGEGFGTKKIPWEYLMGILQSKDVILSKAEFGKYFDHLIYESYPRMVYRYGPHQGEARNVHFLENADDPAIKSLHDRDDWIFLTWTSREIERLSELLAICVDNKAFIGKEDLPIVAYRRFLRSEQSRTPCFAEGEYGELDSKFQMGYRHKRERFVHRLECTGPNCDISRPEFIYTLGGTVTFLLAYEPGMCDAGCELVFQVVNPQENRKCRIQVADEQLGELSMAMLNGENKAIFPIPEQALHDDGTIEVAISPEPGDFFGWDVQSVEIVRARH